MTEVLRSISLLHVAEKKYAKLLIPLTIDRLMIFRCSWKYFRSVSICPTLRLPKHDGTSEYEPDFPGELWTIFHTHTHELYITENPTKM